MSKNMINAWHNFLKTNFNVIMRSSPNIYKERKYEHINIQQRFEDVEKERRRQRLTLIEYRKSLKMRLLRNQLDFLTKNKEISFITDEGIKKELANYSNLKDFESLGSYSEYVKKIFDSQKEEIKLKELKDLKKEEQETLLQKIKLEMQDVEKEINEIKEMRKELEVIDQNLEDLEPTHILVSGLQKKIVLNSIIYYEFQSRNLHGFTINPETLKAIEYVHYQVEHNLPVRREVKFYLYFFL